MGFTVKFCSDILLYAICSPPVGCNPGQNFLLMFLIEILIVSLQDVNLLRFDYHMKFNRFETLVRKLLSQNAMTSIIAEYQILSNFLRDLLLRTLPNRDIEKGLQISKDFFSITYLYN